MALAGAGTGEGAGAGVRTSPFASRFGARCARLAGGIEPRTVRGMASVSDRFDELLGEVLRQTLPKSPWRVALMTLLVDSTAPADIVGRQQQRESAARTYARTLPIVPVSAGSQSAGQYARTGVTPLLPVAPERRGELLPPRPRPAGDLPI